MGLLDDAIREHLDLKRRRGADPAEIERAEREALGPVRRDPVASDEVDETAGPAAAEPGLEGAEPLAESHLETAPAGERFSGELGDDEPDEDDGWDDYEEDDDYGDDEEFEPGHPDPGPDSLGLTPHEPEAHPEGSTAAHPDDPGATRAFQIEPGAEPEAGEEDVLEETPDFLQDTPDHDRLWFEQRPPKDFDFDE